MGEAKRNQATFRQGFCKTYWQACSARTSNDTIMAKKKNKSGYTRQGIKDLSYIKAPSVGIRLPDPPGTGLNCEHSHVRENRELGYSACTDCGQGWDDEGCPI